MKTKTFKFLVSLTKDGEEFYYTFLTERATDTFITEASTRPNISNIQKTPLKKDVTVKDTGFPIVVYCMNVETHEAMKEDTATPEFLLNCETITGILR